MAPRTPPGETRRRIYDFVRRCILDGRSPTVREVQGKFGFRAVQTAREHLETLVEEGLLVKRAGQSRGYRLPGQEPSEPTVLIPLLGQVQAGSLTTAFEEPEGFLAISSRSSSAASRKQWFALRVRGHSMTGAGILEGDIVLVRRQPAADSGDIVVALVGDEATVKTLRLRRSRQGKSTRVELHPAHPDFPVLVPPPEELRLLGKVFEVRRYLEGVPMQPIQTLPQEESSS